MIEQDKELRNKVIDECTQSLEFWFEELEDDNIELDVILRLLETLKSEESPKNSRTAFDYLGSVD